MGKIAGIAAIVVAVFQGSAATALAEERILPWQVLSVVTADWTDDGGMDRAVLYDDGTDDAALAIYVGANGGFERLAFDPDIAWFGAMWGTMPWLEVSDAGSLLIKSGNEAIGRNRWSQTLTVAFRGGAFVVAGYTSTWYDTLDMENNGTCDVNYLTGKGEVAKGEAAAKPFGFAKGALRVGDWTDSNVPPGCN